MATLLMMHRAMEAAALLEKDGISAEVLDPRTLVPFDWELLKESVAKTNRIIVVEESPKRGGLGAEIAATLAEEMIDSLVAPIVRVSAPNTPAPFSPPMERFSVPDAKRICREVKELIRISYGGIAGGLVHADV